MPLKSGSAKKPLPPLPRRKGASPIAVRRATSIMSPAEAAAFLIPLEQAILSATKGSQKLRTRLIDSFLIHELTDAELTDTVFTPGRKARAARKMREAKLIQRFGPRSHANLESLDREISAKAREDKGYFAYRTLKDIAAQEDREFSTQTLVELVRAKATTALANPSHAQAFLDKKMVSTRYARITRAVESRAAAVENFRGTFESQFQSFAPLPEEVPEGLTEYLVCGDNALRSYAAAALEAAQKHLEATQTLS